MALRVTCTMLIPLFIGAATHLLFAGDGFAFGGDFMDLCRRLYASGTRLSSGGLLAGLLSMALEAMFSVYGAIPVLLAIIIFLVMCAAHVTPARLVDMWRGREHVQYEYEEPAQAEAKPAKARGKRRAGEEPERPAPRRRVPASIDIPMDDEPGEDDDYEGFSAYPMDEPVSAPRKAERRSGAASGSTPIPVAGQYKARPEVERPAPQPKMTGFKPASSSNGAADSVPDNATEIIEEDSLPWDEPAPAQEPAPEPVTAPEPEKPKRSARPQPDEKVNAEMAAELDRAAGDTPDYEFPPIDLLRRGAAAAVDGRDEIALNRDRLDASLKSFGVSARIVGATRGPTVTRYDLELDAGVKLTKLTNLANDIALSLGVMNVRIAPIPGQDKHGRH